MAVSCLAYMASDKSIPVEGVLVIRRVYHRLRAEGLPRKGEPRVLASTIIYLYRMGVHDENELAALASHVS